MTKAQFVNSGHQLSAKRHGVQRMIIVRSRHSDGDSLLKALGRGEDRDTKAGGRFFCAYRLITPRQESVLNIEYETSQRRNKLDDCNK